MMAVELDDGEFWLPPQFLSDDSLLMDFDNKSHLKRNEGKLFAENNGGFEFPYGFGSTAPNSDLSSPVESVQGSTETESDEDDFLNGLTQKLAHSTLGEDLWKVDAGLPSVKANKTWSMASSPQSTLCSVMGGGCGCGCKKGSSRGSPNCPSPSQTAEELIKNEAAWDMLYKAAGEVARMRRIEELGGGYYPSRVPFGPPRKQSPISSPFENQNNPNPVFHSNRSLAYHQLQAYQFQQLKHQQMLKQQGSVVWGQNKAFKQNLQAQEVIQSRARSANGRPMGLSASAWPTLQQSQQQQQPGSRMRAVFLGNSGSKRECAGTGVFLPRRVGAPTESRKKPGCSTVLLPDRVVQALNLNLEAMDAPPQPHPRSNHACISSDYDAATLKYRNNVLASQQRQNVFRPQSVTANNEVQLPQEWTY